MSKSGKHTPKTLCFHGAAAWIVLLILIIGGSVLAMWLIRKYIEGPFYRKRNRIDGKVVIITGCNTGIGKATALELAKRGAIIHMACRDEARCEIARLEIIERTGNKNLFNRKLNLASLDSVRAFAARFLEEEQRLDILINNAGIMATPKGLTADGYEQQIGVNHLGHFLLTVLLLDRLKASAPSRIIVLTSIFYVFGRINKDDLMSEKRYSKMLGAYSNSKLANILFVRKLSELLKGTGVTANAAHPGLVRTEIARHNTCNKACWSFWYAFFRFVVKTPRAGAQTSIRLALDPSLEQSSGHYYADTIRFPLMPNARDKQAANWLWAESEKLVGLKSHQLDGIQTVTVDHF